MNLGQIITSVRRSLQDDQYDAAIITEAANDFIFEIFNNNRTRLMESSTTLEGALGDTSVPFPEDALAWIEIYATAPSLFNIGEARLEYGNFMNQYAGFASVTAGTAREWTEYNNGMRFAAPLSVEHTFQFDYIREPTPMTSAGDDCEVPRRYKEMVVLGTKARCMEVDEDYTEAQQVRDLLDPLVTTFIRNEARGGGKTKPTVIRTRRRNLNARNSYIGQ